MAGEFVIGVHGELEWEGRRLAGLWPREQLEVCQDAGATIFGPAVNIRTGKSCAGTRPTRITVIKPCMDVARIPVHPNVGRGRLRRAGERLPARGRRVAGGQGPRRHPALRRLVGGLG